MDKLYKIESSTILTKLLFSCLVLLFTGSNFLQAQITVTGTTYWSGSPGRQCSECCDGDCTDGDYGD